MEKQRIRGVNSMTESTYKGKERIHLHIALLNPYCLRFTIAS